MIVLLSFNLCLIIMGMILITPFLPPSSITMTEDNNQTTLLDIKSHTYVKPFTRNEVQYI